jgi:RNA polymerase sigma-70 factor (ECF subfamily)
LRSAIDQLPDKYRAVITLYHLQGKQYDEIATILGVPMGTVKTHLFRAKDLLRRRLSGEQDEDDEPVAIKSRFGWMQRRMAAV